MTTPKSSSDRSIPGLGIDPGPGIRYLARLLVLALASLSLPALAADPGALAAKEARHVAAAFPGRMAGTPMEDATAKYLADRLLEMGYRPRLERFQTGYEFRWENKPERGHDFRSLVSTNVIAERSGTSGKRIIVGAHYDTRIPRSERDLERNIGGPKLEGLDDNASGTGVLLELAEAFREVAPTHTIVFIAFGAEEIGLLGAHEIVNRMTPEERAATLWMVNIDSIVTGDRLYFHAGPKTYAKDPKAGHARDRALAIAAGLGITATTNPGLNADHPKGTGCCSDQAAFDLAGIPVVNLEATNWGLGDKDGYQQTSKSKAFPTGYSWHLVDIDNRAHLEASLPRAGWTSARATRSGSWYRWSGNSPRTSPERAGGAPPAPIPHSSRNDIMRASTTVIATTLATLSLASVEAATVYTGDVIQGKRVISQLDVNDLEPGKKHSFLFQGVQMGTGQHWYMPVVVAKGAKPGKKVLLTSGVHGDELSPVDAVQRTMAALDPSRMSGTVTAVYDVSRPAKEAGSRFWSMAQSGGALVDLNRVWPGNENGNNPAVRHAGLVFNRLLKPNAEVSLDFHTAATSGDFTAFIYAKLANPQVRAMAELYPVEQIKSDPGEPGTLETSLVEAGIPSMTIEIGGPRSFDRRKIPMFVEGSLNVLKYHKVIEGPMGRTSKEAGTTFGDAFHVVRATHGGFLELLVDLRDKVVAGQKVAIQRNSFGEVAREYTTEVAGEISTLQRDAMIEPGTRVVTVLHDSPDPRCDGDGCKDESYLE